MFGAGTGCGVVSRGEQRIGYRQADPFAQLGQAFFAEVATVMALNHPLLWMLQVVGQGIGNDLVDFVHIQVTPCSVKIFEQRVQGFVPPFEDLVFAGVGWIKVNARFGPTDGRSRDGEFDFHGFGQGLNLPPVQSFAHPSSAAGGPTP